MASSEAWPNSPPKRFPAKCHKTSQTDFAIGASGFDSLALKSRTGLEVATKRGDKCSPLANETAKIAIDLWHILSKHKCFKQDGKTWEDGTEVWEVLEWILRKFDEVLQSEDWAVVQLAHNGYGVALFREYEHAAHALYMLPVHWLPSLEISSPELHDLALNLLHLLCNKTQLAFWWEGEQRHTMEMLLDELRFQNGWFDLGEKEREEFTTQIRYYEVGLPSRYQSLIEQTVIEPEQFASKLEAFSPATKLERELVDWLRLGCKIVRSRSTVHEFAGNKDDLTNGDRNPLTAENWLGVAWDVDDWFFQQYESFCVEPAWNEYGASIPMTQVQIWMPSDKDLVPLPPTSNFPADLLRFYEMGFDLINKITTATI